MFSKSFAASILLLVLTSSVNADGTGIVLEPPLGKSGTPVASDVQHPTNELPCGNAIPQNLDASSCVQADTSGNFKLSFSNFGSGAPTISTMKVNDDGTGKSFVSGQVPTVNDKQISGQLPSGTSCKGGESGNRCVVSFTASDGTGNCILVSQPTDGTKGSNPPVASPSPSPNPSANPQGSANEKGQGANGNGTANDDQSNNGKTSDKDSTGNKRDIEARMRSKNFKRVHVQGKRRSASH